ncbi:MAG: hypothetical protein L0L76_10415 [Yaniella sp.]|uniref:hypothetical protein n=1 Tax=Yaniella sp. TaxID=2773929 RepID=UPI002649E03F|nr:hypothetical protein [Yaniella sp.]MDN6759002.1 hypothetical protein [Yaniella sp.]
MSKQRVIDETQILLAHEEDTQKLLDLWRDGRIDLDMGDVQYDRIESALETLCDILDRSIRARNQQTENIENEPMDRFRRRQIR